MVKIGAIWKNTTEEGKTYFKGKIDLPAPMMIGEGLDILLFRSKSEHEKAPYFDICIAKPLPKKEKPVRDEADYDTTPPPDDATPF